jgi:hypothetical protein
MDQALSRLDEQEKTDMSTDQKQYWWEEVSETIGDFRSGDISGDVIIGQAGAGSQNVAIGKNITQTVYQVVGEPTPEDRTIIEEAVAEVRTELASVEPEIGQQTEQMAQGVLTNLESELVKTGDDDQPNATVITTMGDLLLDNVPMIAEALISLFATPAVGRVVGKAGETAITWVRERFGGK